MNNRALTAFAAYALMLGACCKSPTTALGSEETIGCVESLELPRITDGLDRTWLGGASVAEVMVTFNVTAAGKAEEIVAKSPTPELGNFAMTRLHGSTFKKSCAGQTLRLRYEFEIPKDPRGLDLPAVSLRGNGTIKMVFAPRPDSPPLRLRD